MATNDKKKKKKRSPEQMHRQVQDSLQALPYAIDDHNKKGKWFKAFVLRFMTGPVLGLMNRALNAKRYKGEEGKKLQQADRMRRHLEQRQTAIRHMEGYVQKAQKGRGGGKAR